MTENTRRHRGNHILQALAKDLQGSLRWEPIPQTPPGVKTTSRGMYHIPTGEWHTDAGPQDAPSGPQHATLRIPSLPPINYEGELITITPTMLLQLYTHLSRARLYQAVREWAQMQQPPDIATYWPSHKAVRWTHYPPDHLKTPLRTAVLLMGGETRLTGVKRDHAETCSP